MEIQKGAEMCSTLLRHHHASMSDSMSGWLRMQGATVRGWKRMHFVLRGAQLMYGKSSGREGAVIQLEGCSVETAVAADGSTEKHILSIDRPERGARKLACPSAESLSTWLVALKTAAEDSARVERNSAPEDGTQKSDKKDWLSTRISGPPNEKSADQTAVAQTLLQAPAGALHLALLQSERDKARQQAAALLKEVQELKREKVAAETRMADMSKLCTDLQKNEVAEVALAALQRQRKETMRLSEERQVHAFIRSQVHAFIPKSPFINFIPNSIGDYIRLISEDEINSNDLLFESSISKQLLRTLWKTVLFTQFCVVRCRHC